MPAVASVVVGAAGALRHAASCVGGVWCQGVVWLGVRQLVVVS